MKVVLYRRLSKAKADQSRQHGFDSQENDLRGWLDHNPSAEVIGEFGEFYTGKGHFSKRAEFNKALELCKEEGATLVVNKPDRLARDVESGAHILNNYKVVFTNYPDADRLTMHVLLTVAENEARQISERTSKGLAVAKSKGILLGGANPKQRESFQANRHNHKDYHNHQVAAEKRKPIADMIRDMIKFSRNGLNIKQMATMLNEKGVKTPRGKDWSEASVSNLIKREGIEYTKSKNRQPKGA